MMFFSLIFSVEQSLSIINLSHQDIKKFRRLVVLCWRFSVGILQISKISIDTGDAGKYEI